MRIQATPTFKFIPLIPVTLVLAVAIILIPFLGMEGLWLSAAVALIIGIAYVNRHGNEKKLHFDYQALDWLLIITGVGCEINRFGTGVSFARI